jgi:hypothetical protein
MEPTKRYYWWILSLLMILSAAAAFTNVSKKNMSQEVLSSTIDPELK